MSVKELYNILKSIPYEILTYGNSDYEFDIKTHCIKIIFKGDSIDICSITVDTDRDMSIFTNVFIFESSPLYKCVQAMKNTKTYLEILGFKII